MTRIRHAINMLRARYYAWKLTGLLRRWKQRHAAWEARVEAVDDTAFVQALDRATKVGVTLVAIGLTAEVALGLIFGGKR